ncbi:RNA-binding ribosome biosynthesis protein mak21 [Savitreella phatthalungensis]
MSSHDKRAERRRHGKNKADKRESTQRHDLLKEIEALGGDAEDLVLIEGVDSDEENVPDASAATGKAVKTSQKPAGLGKELRKFAQGLGFGTGNKSFIDEQTVDDDDDDDEDGNESDIKEEEVKIETKKKSVAEVKMNGKAAAAAQDDDADFKIHTKRSQNGLLIEAGTQWHEVELDVLPESGETPPFVIERLHTKAIELLERENETYAKVQRSTSRQFLSTIMKSGTLPDRISALTLVVTESPIHAIKTLETLLSMCRKKSRNEAVSTIAAVKDLMQGTLLPDRKLIPFKERTSHSKASDRHLIIWAFEDMLKSLYFDLLGVIEGLSIDPLPFPRNHMVRYVYDLLKDKPEQEANLLRLLVNKLGDKDSKIASKASHFILQLQQAHPMMKAIIVREVESFLFRPQTTSTAQYYSVITLNQTILSMKEQDVANQLVEIYFTFFSKLAKAPAQETVAPIDTRTNRKGKKAAAKAVQTQTEDDAQASKMLSAVLTGINRAFPFSALDKSVFAKHLDALYRITHDANLNTAIQALILLNQVAQSDKTTADRFYRTLYDSLFDNRLITSSKQALYLNTFVKALKNDTDAARVKAFAKRLVQSMTLHQPSFICAAFYLLGEVETVHSLRGLLTGEVADGDEEVKEEDSKPTVYDPRQRDPRFARAAGFYELSPFLRHYHPAVCMFAEAFMQRKKMPGKPDLSLHTLSHFLDRFVYRNAKTKATDRGGSIMQPQQVSGAQGREMVLNLGKAANRPPVNSDWFLKQRERDVAPEDVFFYKYFQDRSRVNPQAGKNNKKKGVTADGELDEDDVWQALVNSRPEVEAPSDDDDDDDSELDAMAEAMEDESDLELPDEEGDEALVMDDDDDEVDSADDDEGDEVDSEEDVEDEEEVEEADDDSVELVEDPDFDLGEDEDDLLPTDSEEEDQVAEPPAAGQKRKHSADPDDKANADNKAKAKRKQRAPAFASADDYAHLLD